MSLWYSPLTVLKQNFKIVFSFSTKSFFFFLKQGTCRRCPAGSVPIRPVSKSRSGMPWSRLGSTFQLSHRTLVTPFYPPEHVFCIDPCSHLRAFQTSDVTLMASINTSPCFSIFRLKCRNKKKPFKGCSFVFSYDCLMVFYKQNHFSLSWPPPPTRVMHKNIMYFISSIFEK